MSLVNTYWQIGYNLDLNLFGAASPAEVLVKEPAMTLAVILKDEIRRGAAPSSTSTSIKPYVVVPTVAASIKKTIPKYQRQYFARVGFATLMGTKGISLKPVLIDNTFIQLWTADLNESLADYLRGQSYIITSVFPESFGTHYTGDRGEKKSKRKRDVASNSTKLSHAENIQGKVAERNPLPGWDVRPARDEEDPQMSGFELGALSELGPGPAMDGDFFYPSTAGEDSDVYVIESDPFDVEHEDIDLPKVELEGWIYSEPGALNPPLLYHDPENDEGHGTAVGLAITNGFDQD